jgi:O-antigen ligase
LSVLERVKLQGWETFSGGKPLFVPDIAENVTRIAIFLFGFAPIIFSSIELSPTAWGIAAPVLLLPLCLLPGFRVNGNGAILVAALAILTAISTTWSDDPPRAVKAAWNIVAYGVAAVVLTGQMEMLSENGAIRVWRALVIGSVAGLAILLAFELYVVCITDPTQHTYYTRILHKTTFYGFVAFSVLLADAGNRIVLRMAFLLFGLPVIFLGRSSGISLAVFMIVAFVALGAAGDTFIVLLLSGYAILVLLAPLLLPTLMTELEPYFQFVPRSFIERLDLWSLISGRVWEAPLVGHGVDTLRVSTDIIQGARFYALPDIPSAHNIALDLWYDLGLLGALALVGAVVWIGYRVLVTAGPARRLNAFLLIGFLTELSVDHRVWVSWVMGTIVYALAVSQLGVMVLHGKR